VAPGHQQVGLAAASTAGWIALVSLDTWATRGAQAVRFPATAFILWQLVINGLVHSALAGIGYAWQTAGALQEARDRAARAELLRTRAELQLMRSQLQPHFVNNTLHALLGLVRRDPALAEKALEKLGELLHFGQWVHQSGSDWVPLSREWDFVRSYLELERMRLGDRLRVSLEADQGALDVTVPPFSLQPVVENAIVHAVAPRASGGRVTVSARRSGGRLTLSVADDGPGSAAAAIAGSSRIGLHLLQERLAAAIERVRGRLGQPAVHAGERARSSLTPGPLTRLFARRGDRIVPITVEGIRRVRARDDYAEVHAAEGEFLLHLTLSELADRLDPARFRQVHRSHIVNLDQVLHMRPFDDRRLAITLKDGTVIVASRAASEELRRLAR
jgi:hypothetical protein